MSNKSDNLSSSERIEARKSRSRSPTRTSAFVPGWRSKSREREYQFVIRHMSPAVSSVCQFRENEPTSTRLCKTIKSFFEERAVSSTSTTQITNASAHASLQKLKSQRQDMKGWTEQWEKQFVAAEKNEDIAIMRDLIVIHPHGVNAHLEIWGGPLLLLAVDSDHSKSIKFLLDCGALLETGDQDYTPLFTACENGCAAAVFLLLERGTNITGEFLFNDETALSIAAFKLCYHVEQAVDGYQSADAAIIRQNRPYNHWERFTSEKLTFDLAETAVKVALVCIPSQTDDELMRRLITYVLVREKVCIVRKHTQRMLMSESDYLEAATSPAADYRWTHPLPDSAKAIKMSKKALKDRLEHLNSHLKSTAQAKVQWDNYPVLFVAQYRGLHMYERHFGQNILREDYLRSTHLHRIAPAPAVYSMCSLTVSDHSLARESTLSAKANALRESFTSMTAKDKNDLQVHMSSEYAKYIASVQPDNENPSYRTLAFMNAIGYPHVATSDLPYHALRYAAGLKPVNSLKESRLLPQYDSSGCPKHPILGKIFVSLLRPQQLQEHCAVHVSADLGNKLSVYIRPERETSLPGALQTQIVFMEGLFQVPDLSQRYSAQHAEKYGLSESQFTNYCKLARSGDLVGKPLDSLLASVATYMQQGLLRIAQQEALRRGGHLVYCHEASGYGLYPVELQKPLNINAKQTAADDEYGGIYRREQDLMKDVGEERFSTDQSNN